MGAIMFAGWCWLVRQVTRVSSILRWCFLNVGYVTVTKHRKSDRDEAEGKY
jgi:hypothetical protein